MVVWRKVLRVIEIVCVTILLSIFVALFLHYGKIIPYYKIIGLGLIYVIYRIVKFISIRNKRLFIKNY